MENSEVKDLKRSRYQFKLYICSKSVSSRLAQNRIISILKNFLAGNYNLEIINISQNPEVGEAKKISATPTLVKIFPLPKQKLIGDLNNREKLLKWFNFS